MASNSKIEWTHHTFNPWRGCTKVSDGCKNCYADTLSKRNPGTLGVWGPNGSRVVAAEAYWRQPLKWNAEAAAAGERHRVFCASLADVFEDWSGDFPDNPAGVNGGVRCMVDTSGARLCTRVGREIARQWPDEAGWRPYTMQDVRYRLWELIEATPHLDWLLLTKRPEHVPHMVKSEWLDAPGSEGYGCWPSNCWLGTSVENQQTADERIPRLLECPATVRFLSCEPLLGAVDLGLLHGCRGCNHPGNIIEVWNEHGRCEICDGTRHEPSGLHWVIVGGESGPGARPCNLAWIRSIVEQCKVASVPAFVKQLGFRPVAFGACDCGRIEHGRCHQECPRIAPQPLHLRDRKGGDMAEWPEDLRVRELPERKVVV